jgi:hypothetical protein
MDRYVTQIHGGMQWVAAQNGKPFGGGCSAGFPAYLNGHLVMISASHCSPGWMEGPFGDDVFQPWDTFAPRFGYEYYDPQYFSCFSWGYKDCRNSDGIAYKLEGNVMGFAVARTLSWNGSTTIDESNPTLPIVGLVRNNIVGEYLDKMGRTSGWTYGAVAETCEDRNLRRFDGEERRVYCMDRINTTAEPGDSGGPVFRLVSSNGAYSAEIRGIVSAEGLWLSDVRQIEVDLGALRM